MFAAYIAGFYGHAALRGRWGDWNLVFPRGHVAALIHLKGRAETLPVSRSHLHHFRQR
ncbi:hypothetical protein [Lysobacter sp. yr284]|uniref:hypothetical protein n=1 Tax=Lysobacter sp. yr284 TaxID=1761791 RepID=UPI001587BCAE|nr:hypothetical protein [Lysobacter sp. yr284]